MEKNSKKEDIIIKKCCCFSLKSGTIIVSIIDIVLNILAIAFLVTCYNLREEEKKSEFSLNSEYSRCLTIALIIKQIIEIITNFALIYCSQKKLSVPMAAWVRIKKHLFFISAACFWIFIISTFFSRLNIFAIAIGLEFLMTGNVFIVASLFAFEVTRNRHREIESENETLEVPKV